MEVIDAKLSESLKKSEIAQRIISAIKTEYEKMQSKGIFSQPMINKKNSKEEPINENKALFGDDTFEHLGIKKENQGFEPAD